MHIDFIVYKKSKENKSVLKKFMLQFFEDWFLNVLKYHSIVRT